MRSELQNTPRVRLTACSSQDAKKGKTAKYLQVSGVLLPQFGLILANLQGWRGD